MKRTTIMLPPKLKLKAQQRANALGMSLGKFIRAAIEKSLELPPATLEADPIFDDVEVYSGDVPKDLAENHDKYLYGE